jgi:hypothetical protein
MTELVLQPRKTSAARRQPAVAPAAPAADTARLTTLDSGVTPYDELWYERRPQRP